MNLHEHDVDLIEVTRVIDKSADVSCLGLLLIEECEGTQATQETNITRVFGIRCSDPTEIEPMRMETRL
jgi:hypothetical protein